MEFLGAVYGNEKLEVFRSCDFFLLPSYNEGFPIAIIEAMSAGLPIITTPVGGIPDVIKDEQSGFLINPGDYASMAQRILTLASNSSLRKRMGELNRSIVKEQFLKDAFIEKIDAIFKEA